MFSCAFGIQFADFHKLAQDGSAFAVFERCYAYTLNEQVGRYRWVGRWRR